jgi:2-isopropylmalate synthase
MLNNPASKYQPVVGPDLPSRQWPGRRLVSAPRWLSTDLRDGNQALFEPMNLERKLRLFHTLLAVGFKEIEVAFPAASQTDFDFTRHIIEHDLIPDDVTIMVMTQARADLIERTFEALRGVRRATISLYNATAPVWRRDVFGLSRNEVLCMAVDHARLVLQHFDANPGTHWTLQYSPEAFSATEMPFAAEVCNAVIDAVAPSPERPMIINLPATVEVSTPNVFADQIEWMDQHLHRREALILSIHPHNDRGTAVAAAELALLAGAQRVEGCLFGQGERSGNVDLVTLALNLYTQGIAPGLDFSNIDETLHVVEHCSQLPISPRHPYVGELVYTAFSGSHQDAIHKGLTRHRDSGKELWEVPYLPIDPADLGRDYASVIRINSQSGKGGTAHLLASHYGLKLPRRMLIDFSNVVQEHADSSGREISAGTLLALWLETYQPEQALRLVAHQIDRQPNGVSLSMALREDNPLQSLGSKIVGGTGATVLDAALHALRDGLGWPIVITHHECQTLGQEECVVMLECSLAGLSGRHWGIGLHTDADTAILMALLHCAEAWRHALPQTQQTEPKRRQCV